MEQGTVEENKTNQVTAVKLVRCTTASPSAHAELPLVKHMCSGIAPFAFYSGGLSSRRGPASIPGSLIQEYFFFSFFFSTCYSLVFIGALTTHEVCVLLFCTTKRQMIQTHYFQKVWFPSHCILSNQLNCLTLIWS